LPHNLFEEVFCEEDERQNKCGTTYI